MVSQTKFGIYKFKKIEGNEVDNCVLHGKDIWSSKFEQKPKSF